MFATGNQERLLGLGFKFGKSGAHAARTMMLTELRRLLGAFAEDARRADYRAAIVHQNLLDKPTLQARKLSFDHLRDLDALDPGVCLFRVFRRL